ncbi:DUF917 domain-containing protein [Pseudoroseicyclus tamaricis]|uniref:DUF917 domain-containing protein n=1 Tax=Pseudoroseicyclus tamaricis TaxID=2705421 RepID=A0A6B2JVM0_9RHOB|nr:DUF917 domain-containing protein [Pseudoroseicyclus tamaricis]NDV00244.1 DUF917 domain-containing protein [Pseudoroseicyclus tamaricis]
MSDGFLIREGDLAALSLGAALLGTGGGGNPYLGMLRTRELLRKGGEIRILPLEALADEAQVCTVGGIGAPVIGVEKLAEGGETYRALKAVADTAGVEISALIAAEIGGANAMAPMIVAAQAGLPVIDGDGMGRAFPEVQMSTFAIYGARSDMAALADDKGNVVVVRHVASAKWMERFLRATVVEMGAGGGAAGAPMSMAEVRRAAIPGTVSQALEIGAALLDARKKRHDPVARLAEVTGGRVCFAGKITDVRRELTGGFVRGHAELTGAEAWQGSTARIAIQNENLVLWVDGEPRVCVPDLIMNVDLDTGEPITTEMLRYGQRVAVLGIPAHPLLTSPEALAVVGPEAFGYPELTFTPL